MDWFQSKAAQIIGLVSIIGTLAGFGYTGATYVNRIENLESKMVKYINEIDALGDEVSVLDKQVVAVDEQIKSLNIETQDLSPIKADIVELQTSVAGLNVETQDLSPIKADIVALQTSVAGINASVDIIYVDVQSLKNINDNPLAN